MRDINMMDYISFFLFLICLCRLPRSSKVLPSFGVPGGILCGLHSALTIWLMVTIETTWRWQFLTAKIWLKKKTHDYILVSIRSYRSWYNPKSLNNDWDWPLLSPPPCLASNFPCSSFTLELLTCKLSPDDARCTTSSHQSRHDSFHLRLRAAFLY